MTKLDINTVLDEIRAWHKADRRITLERTFALGDLILKAVIHTGKTEYEIIKRIMADLGSLAMGQTTYNRAGRLVRVFTAAQRRVLTEHAVSLAKCETLASAAYDGRRRIKLIAEIKAGKLRAPWDRIRASERPRSQITRGPKEGRVDDNPDYIALQIYHKGQPDKEQIKILLKSIISRIGQGLALELWSAAISSPSPFPCSVTCVWCGSGLRPSPTDKWWIKKTVREGLCYDCIVNSMRNVICGLDADKSPNDQAHFRACSEAEGS